MLFPHCQPYIGADIQAGPQVDRVLTADGLTREKSGEYQVVLSSQVLEHVQDADAYLRECHRLLRPGGRLLLSTHGMFHEHGCPNDFYRWTSRGLETLIGNHGFEIVESVKLTVEFRGAIQLLHYFIDQLARPRNPVRRIGWAIFRRVYRKVGMPVLNRIGRGCGGSGVVPATHPARIYVGIGVEARKPAE
jgi:SAM-dependent methyltransferase